MLTARTVCFAAVLAVLVGPVLLRLRPGVSLWAQLAEATGLLALSALVCAAVLASRLRPVTRALGADGVHALHRAVGTAAAALVLLHIGCVVAEDPANTVLLDATSSGPAARAATAATAALVALVVLAIYRGRGRHETWRAVHLTLTAMALGLSALHVWWLGQLVQDPTMSVVLAGLAALVATTAVYRWGWLPADPAAEFVVRAVHHRDAAVRIVAEPARSRHRDDGGWPFAAGQFAWLRLNRARGAQEHPFSIASSAADPRRVELLVRPRGDFTRELAAVRPGRRVWLDGPHGSFGANLQRATAVGMVAGGVGIAPMLAILRTAADRGDPRPYRLVQIGAPILAADLTALTARLDLGVTATRQLTPQLLDTVFAQPGRVDWLVCGPPPTIRAVLAALAAAAVPDSRIHTEQLD